MCLRLPRHLALVWLAALLVSAAGGAAAPRLALVLDSSGSMAESDPRRYGVHFAKVMALTLPPDAGLTALWPRGPDCRPGGETVATVHFDPTDRAAFESALDTGVGSRGGNVFGPTLAQARTLLGSPATGSVLAILADGGGASAAERRARYDSEIARRVTAAGGRHEDVDVRVSLLWNTRDDLDLYVTPPSGETISFRHMRSGCGGVLDVDRNAGTLTREPVENIRWPRGQAPKGTYRVVVQNFAFKEIPPLPIPFVVEVATGERSSAIPAPPGPG